MPLEDEPWHLPPSAKLVLILVVLAVGVAQGFGRFTYALVLPAIERDLLHSYAVAGWFGTANLTAYLFGVMLVSLAAARLDPVDLIVLGLVMSTGGLAAMTVAVEPGLLLGGMIATGAAGAFIWIPSPALAGSVVPEHRRGFAIGLMGSGIGVAMLFAAELTHIVQARYGGTGERCGVSKRRWRRSRRCSSLSSGFASRTPDARARCEPPRCARSWPSPRSVRCRAGSP